MSSKFSAGEILQGAVRIEENGQRFYTGLAEKFADKKMKQIFNYLAQEEEKHRDVFLGLISRIENYQPRENYPFEYFEYLRAYAGRVIFTKEAVDSVIEGVDSEKKAVEYALKMETDSILYYIEAKNMVAVSETGIIDNIIDEERGHYLKLAALNPQE